MTIEKLKKQHFGLYDYHAHGTICLSFLPIKIEAHGFGRTHKEAIADLFTLVAKVKTQ